MPTLTSNSSIAWRGWVTSTTTYSNVNAWTTWVTNGVTTSSTNSYTAASLIWGQWQFGQQPVQRSVLPHGYRCTHPLTFAEHEAALAARRRTAIARIKDSLSADIRAMERKKAAERAERLLLQHLTAEQRRDRAENGFFLVEVKSGRRYKIERNGQHGNVKLVDERGSDLASFCIQPRDAVPDADAHLAQKLLLLIDEEQFIRTANISYRTDAARRALEPIKLRRAA